MRVRISSFMDHEFAWYARVATLVAYVPTERFGNEDGSATAVVACSGKWLNAHEVAALAREQHGATVKIEVDEDSSIKEGDRGVWDRDPNWLYEVVGVNRMAAVQAVLLRRVKG